MPYVSVPVPEELVPEVLRHLVRLMGAAPQDPARDWDLESVAAAFDSSDELTRSILSLLALPGNAGTDVPLAEVARTLELENRDVGAAVTQLLKRAKQDGFEPPLDRRHAEGRDHRRGRPVLHMSAEMAALVREAEARELDAGG